MTSGVKRNMRATNTMPSLACTLEGARSRAVPNPKPASPQTTTAYLRVMCLSPKISDITRRHQRQRGEHEAQLTEILEDHTKTDSVPEFGCLFSHKRILSPLRPGGKRSFHQLLAI